MMYFGMFADDSYNLCYMQEGKRRFDKETTKFSQSLDRYLNMKQNKSNETQLLEVWWSVTFIHFCIMF